MSDDQLAEGIRRGRVPMFTSQPTATVTSGHLMGTPMTDPYTPAEPGADLDPSRYESPETDTDRSEPEVPRAGRTSTSGTRTEPKTASAKEVGQLVAALVVAVAVGASKFVRWRTGNRLRLRQPTPEQAADVGHPLGRIAYRHIPLPQLIPDLADAIDAAVGVNRYLDDGPLILYAPADANLPPDLNQEPT